MRRLLALRGLAKECGRQSNVHEHMKTVRVLITNGGREEGKEGPTDGRVDGGTDGQTDGRTNGRTDGRLID